jgi:TonB family protein
LLLSVLVQIGILAALILIPVLSKTPRIALANVMPVPPYRHAVTADHATPHQPHIPRTHQFTFCLTCPPVVITSHTQSTISGRPEDNFADTTVIEDPSPDCIGCAELIGKSHVQPVVPPDTTPSIVRITHIDPAMLIRRVEPIYPTLPRQTGREGRVELHAIIGTDGAVRSLQFLEGDPMFYQSALDAVRQWRYKPTVLNGRPVEVDTHITVIYKLNRWLSYLVLVSEMREHPEIARVVETADFNQTIAWTLGLALLRGEHRFFLSTLKLLSESVNVHWEKCLSAQQCLDAFEDPVGFALGTNSLEPGLSGFVT